MRYLVFIFFSFFLVVTAVFFFREFSFFNSFQKFPVIDAHIHTAFDASLETLGGVPYTEAQLIQEMKENNVVAAVAHTPWDNSQQVLTQLKNIIHCVGLNGKPGYSQWLEADLRSGKFKCIKIYLGYVEKYSYDSVYRPAFQLAEKYKIPIVFHTGDLYPPVGKLKYSHPLTIDEVASDYPQVTFVIAHLGNPWIETAAEIAYKNSNVYLDGSALLVGNMDLTSEVMKRTYLIKPIEWAFGYIEDPTKLMYGTDWPLNKMAGYLKAFKRAIPKEHWKAVFHDNAARIFKIQQ